MFKWNRVLVALIGVPLLLFIYAGESFFRINLYGLPMLIFTNLVIGVGIYEFYKMVKVLGKEVYDKFGIIVALIIPNLVYLSNRSSYLEQKLITVVLIVATIFMLTYRVFKNQIKGTLEKVSFTLLGIIYVSVFFSQIINLYFLGAVFPLILQVLVWVSDTSAGIVGVAIGRKFFKNGFTEISPKKSVEGALGSIIFTGLAFMLIVVLYIEKINGATGGEVFLSFIIGAIISVVAQIGDLIESLFKRECGVKDSGTILMGHGGVLDRFDSMILVLPFVTMVLYFFHLYISYQYGIN
ncbi:phosphatidate cytidylyltransferase [Fusobacterium polymorphum]|jgi:cytidylyltransferase family|uniref:Phosphatidate cytidylyltransferase n=1 Tax=Fusobacterium nucleatum subsp. polymorphum TaxID=76857 RepID=A0A0S2ZT22_FUSNP|nr:MULTISPECIES: phosphatidate cytidylyltransferase [Fusobacterium]ALM94144.1 phosphatidate cytidylyltransferase [Fusobacterium polymorphum]ALQ41855.1 phosphatidate cytidylyltransferase [Fusobacterium polymorphum]ASG27535.1 phosphatidate cytidylyltransferase [Fusobacterium polymorphum]MCG6841094.1 phosphatidate cytidylyltransferase [Fusobacterium nucleatum]QYR61978.1 phosphatidate cytidylyltransferase [Fusobacterium polymorphum]